MTAPTNTYDFKLELTLGQVPDIEDEVLYEELLDIHNAIEGIAISITDFTNRSEAIRQETSDYSIEVEDYTVLANATLRSVTLLLPIAADSLGLRYSLKSVDDDFGTFVNTRGTEKLDDEEIPFELFRGEYIEVISDGTNWIVA